MQFLPKAPTHLATLAGLLCSAFIGCSPSDEATTPQPSETGPVRVLVLEDVQLAEAISKQWRRTDSDVELDVRERSVDEVLATTGGALGTDVVIYPAGLLGEFAERDWITAVPSKVLRSASLQRDDLLGLERRGSLMWGQETLALTFGSPQLTLLYRQDILEDQRLRQQLGLAVPQTWTEYQTVAERLADVAQLGNFAPQAGMPWSGIVEPLGSGWAGQVLLARAAAYTRSRGRDVSLFNANTMEPLIDHAPFVRALTELVAAAEVSGAKDRWLQFSPHDARRELLEGRTAMALCWPTHSAGFSVEEKSRTVEVAFAPLPGSTTFYTFGSRRWESRPEGEDIHVPLIGIAGRLGSVTKDSPRSQAAFNLLVWLTNERNGMAIASQSGHTTLFRTSQLNSAAKWVDPAISAAGAVSYAEVLQQTNESEIWLHSIRLPGRARYLAALDEAVRLAMAGKPPAEALSAAAAQWNEITAALGADAQREAYWRSLGVE